MSQALQFTCHDTMSHLCVFLCMQDSTPAGTIFCEDVEDCVEDHSESKKDSKVLL